MSKVYTTTNYDQFKFYKTNRDINAGAIIDSIKNKNFLKDMPILCDKDLYVIDGQHRLYAARVLRVPIYYTISEDLGENDIGQCQIQKPWLAIDYLKFNISKPTYAFIHMLKERYRFSLHFIISACSNKYHMKHFRNGTYELSKPENELEDKFEELKQVCEFSKSILKAEGKNKDFTVHCMRGIWSFINRKEYIHSQMLHKLRTYPSMIEPLSISNDSVMAQKVLDNLYNYGSRSKKTASED